MGSDPRLPVRHIRDTGHLKNNNKAQYAKKYKSVTIF